MASRGDRTGYADVYRYYQVPPYFNTNRFDEDNTAGNTRKSRAKFDREQQSFLQGTSRADRELTRNIRAAIEQSPDLSESSRNIQVLTRDGRVVLRGTADSEAEKVALAALARRYATAGEIVDNQLEVKGVNVNR